MKRICLDRVGHAPLQHLSCQTRVILLAVASGRPCHATPPTWHHLFKKNKNKNKNKKSVSVRSSFSTATSQCQVAGERVRLLRLEYHLFLKGKTPVDDGSHWAAAG